MKIITTSFFLILFSCNSANVTGSIQNFPSGTYELVEFKADNFKPEKTYTINVDTNKHSIGGKFDCNSFFSDYERDGENINFGYPISTKMYCEGKMNNENAFFKQLKAISTFKYQNETLKFFGGNNGLIVELKYLSDE